MPRAKRGPRPQTGLPGRLPTNRGVMVVEQRATGLMPTRASIVGRVKIGHHQCLILQLRKSA